MRYSRIRPPPLFAGLVHFMVKFLYSASGTTTKSLARQDDGGGGLGDAAGLGEGVALGVGRDRPQRCRDENNHPRASDHPATSGREGQIPAKRAQNAAKYGSHKWHRVPNHWHYQREL